MKKSVILFVVLCGAIACAIVLVNKQKAAPPAPSQVENTVPAPADNTPAPEKAPAPKPAITAGMQPAAVATATAKTAVLPATAQAKPDDASAAVHKLVDDLLAPKSGLDKHNLFQQLVKAGQIDAAIADLKQRAVDNPNDAGIPTTLGEAILNKLRDMRQSGTGDYNQIGILAMQADQSFNDALKIDPQNWEAQFVKNSSMTYWPANPEVDNQVVQNLSKLIDQQETLPSQPQFAQTFVVLGNEYQKLGQADKALATWQMGLQKFPSDPTLQKKVNGQ